MMSLSLTSVASALWLALFSSTCCLALPSVYRRAYHYYPPIPLPVLTGYGLENVNNGWEVAQQEPLAYDDTPAVAVDDYYDGTQWSDIQALSNLLDTYDDSTRWGRIVNEAPDDSEEADAYAEKELTELKRSHPVYAATSQQRGSLPSSVSSPSSSSTPALTVTTSAPRKSPPPSLPTVAKAAQKLIGQKEIAMLRPPNSPNRKFQQAKAVAAVGSTAEPAAPAGIVSAQLSSTERQKKPSPYDTLREYLSIEDALKKEAAKRRLETRHQKRSSGSGSISISISSRNAKGIVADEASLTGQLTNLKKTIA